MSNPSFLSAAMVAISGFSIVSSLCLTADEFGGCFRGLTSLYRASSTDSLLYFFSLSGTFKLILFNGLNNRFKNPSMFLESMPSGISEEKNPELYET